MATSTNADRPQWQACLANLRPGDTLIIWNIDQIGRSLRDLVDIIAALEARGVAVKSLANGIIDTTTVHGRLAFGMFALQAEHEGTFAKEQILAELAVTRARARARNDGPPNP